MKNTKFIPKIYFPKYNFFVKSLYIVEKYMKDLFNIKYSIIIKIPKFKNKEKY